MKIAKAVALLFALVLVVVCFNSPLVLADHPWDEEGYGGGGDKEDGNSGSGTDPDSVTITDPDRPNDEPAEGFTDPGDSDWIVNLQLFILFQIKPDAGQGGSNGDDEANMR
jgi:hypothetical protein